VDANIYHLSKADQRRLGIKVLPASLKEALEEWKSDSICEKALGKELAEKYAEFKTQEWQEYEPNIEDDGNQVTGWEVQKYLYG
jgi:glutamine synthetase